jgi:hypothetical protein
MRFCKWKSPTKKIEYPQKNKQGFIYFDGRCYEMWRSQVAVAVVL